MKHHSFHSQYGTVDTLGDGGISTRVVSLEQGLVPMHGGEESSGGVCGGVCMPIPTI